MLGVPHRSGDLKFISSIEGYRGNIHKLGRLLRHDWFSIEEEEGGGKTKERYLFLFKGKILVCKVRRIQDDRSVFALKEILRLPELELKDIPEDTKAFYLRRNPKVEAVKGEFEANFPLLVKAHADEVKVDWLADIRQHAVEVHEKPVAPEAAPKKDQPSDIKKTSEQETQKKEDIKTSTKPTQQQTESPAAAPAQAPTEIKAAPSLPTTPDSPVEAPAPPKKTETPAEAPPKQSEVTKPEETSAPPKKAETPAEAPSTPKKVDRPEKVSEPQKKAETPAEVPSTPKQPEIPAAVPSVEKQPEGPITLPAPKKVDSPAEASTELKKQEVKVEAPSVPKQIETPVVSQPIKVESPAESVKEVKDISSEPPGRTKRKDPELDTTVTADDNPPKKLAKEDTDSSVNGRQEPGEMDSSFSMSRKSSRSSRMVEEYQSVSSSYAASTQEEMYVESSSSASARRSSSLRSSSVRYESDGIAVAENGALSIESVPTTPIIARGSLGSDKKPVFTRTIEGFSCEPGEMAEFQCEVRSDTITSLTWLKDNRPLDDRLADRISVKQQADKHRLEIQHCRETDSGLYTALASNDYGVNSSTAQLIVQELTTEERKRRDEDKAPIFLVRLKDTCLMENTYLRFMIKVKGNPNPEVRFYKDGKEIRQENPEDRVHVVREQGQKKGFYELVIMSVQHSDAGKYSCKAMNEYGDSTCEAEVTVTDEKTIFAGLEDVTDASEKPTFTWLRDGQPFDPEERFKVLFKDDEDSLALVFQHVKPEDAGLYTCVASTSSGKISCSAELTVKGSVNQLMKEPEKPKLITEIKTSEVNVGGSAMLELKASGYPKPDVKWYKESGEEVTAGGRYRFLYEDEESIALVIKGATTDDSGKYKITAKNEIGEDTAEIQLSVKSPPKILTKTMDMVCKVKETFEMTIEVEGTPAPDVKWYKDGQEVSASATVKIGSKKGSTSSSMSHSLTLTSTKLEDAGSYSVVATNELSQSSSFWKLTVKSPPHFVRNPAPETIIGEGEAVTIEARVEGNPAPTVKWLKDNREIQEDGKKIKITSEGISHFISITGSGRGDAGIYTCVASNEFGTEQESGTLHVRCPPQFKQGLPKEAHANEGDVNVEFVVNVEAFPKANIKWYLDEIEITEKKTEYTRIEEGDSYKLIIREVTTETSGKYSCKVFNDLGSSESSCSFTVLCKPRFSKVLSDKAVDEGDSLTLTIECYSNPEPDVKWFKDGEEIKVDTRIHIKRQGSETYNLSFDIVKKGDTGEYEVRAKNDMGEIISRSKLHVHFAPEILSSNMTDDSLYESLSKVYEVKATGSPRPEAKWFKDGQQLKSSDRINISDSGEIYKLEIKNSLISDEGVYKCVVSNRLGEKSVECKLSLISVNEFRKPKITCELKDLKVKKGEDAVLRATIIADPIPDITWYHDEKKLCGEGDKVVAEMEEGPKEIGDGLKECTFTLKVPSGQHSDSGVYRIRAKNKFGEGDCSARLDILLKPEIDGMKDVTTIPHETIIFKVIIYANPLAKVFWTRNGEKISASEKVKIIENLEKEEYQIQLFDVGLAEDGVYIVTATNDQGETTSTATLKVHTEPPTFVKNLEDQTVKAYHDADFRIRANGIPKPQIKWYKDGVELKSGGRIIIEIDEEHQTSSLVVEHMEEGDEGLYTVRAKNIVGDAETSSKLSMAQIPPSFTRPLDRSAEVDEGDKLELKVKVDGSPLPTVKWYKDGEEITPEQKNIELVALPDGNIKLTIESVRPTDCGAYKLVVANKNGEKAAVCAVAVKPTPRRPSFVKGLEDAKLVVGQPLKLEVQVMAFPAPEVKWFKDGHPIRPSQAVNFVNSPGGIIGLHMDSVQPEDAGHYTITVANRLGEITGEADVEVEARERKPHFQAFLQPVHVVEGYPAKMEIKVLGHPKPTLKWTHNGKEIVPDGQKISVKELPDGTVCLLIDKATPGDAGEYAVIASNEKGDVTSKAILDVAGKERDAPEEPPSFVHELRDVSADEGSSLNLEAPFLGNPIPEVKWTKDGLPLKAGERNMMTCDGRRVGLEVKPVSLSDAGQYECILTNPLGSATSGAKAIIRKIYQKPSFTQTFGNLQQLPGFDAKFPVKVAGFPTPELTWYKNGEPIDAAKHPDKYRIRKDGDTCCLFVRDCVPGDAGRYCCKAVNLDGEASCEATLDVVDKIEKGPKAEPPSFLKRIGDCEVCQSMTAKFTACATGYPEPEFEWLRNGERLYPSDRIKAEKEGSGLLRLSIANVCPSDVGQYSLRIWNPHGEDKCDAQLTYDSLESRPKRPIGDQYVDYDKFRRTGLPLPLADRPIISRMTDRRLTLSWKPYIPIGPADRGSPVTYRLEMCEMPDGDWFTVRSGIRSCACDVSNLEPFRDYKFRVRVENKYGISDPSPFAITYREKLEPEAPKFFPYLEPGIDFRPETSPYFPKDFDIEKPPHDGYSQAPRFLRQEHDTQYGVKGHNCNLFWFVYGYPKPKMTYYFNDEVIEMGGRYDASYTRNGQATLFINRMLDRDVGWYEAVARNEFGEARQRVRLEIAEFPKFITRPEEIIIMLRRSGRLEARVTGVPYPEIKWYKDWQPLAPSSRIKMMFHPPDTCILSINDVINRDEGLYSISACNVAGSVSASAMIHVEEDERQYVIRTYGRYGTGREIKARHGDGPKGFNELYDIGDELGRGTQGITYHAVERLSGHSYAAKIMHGKGMLRPFMYNELEILNMLNHRKILRLHEAFETDRSLSLILELASGGEFFEVLAKQSYYTESDIAGYIRQILWALEHMHEHSIAHLGLTPGDILFSHPGGDEVKICDFGLARRISFGKLASLNYGVPEFVAPEVVRGDGVSFPADMWSLGIIVQLLLSGGTSLFRGRNDKETLEKIKSLHKNSESFLSSLPDYLSPDARDFIRQLLEVQVEKRMDVTTALKHPWLVRADRIVHDEYQIGTSGLRTYLSGLRDWYSNASCRKWFRRRPLEGAYTDPSRMVYPPGMSETPPDTPRVSVDRTPKEVSTWEYMLPAREPVGYEIGMPTSESHYQYGPDTYLLQLRDVSFPVRLREYMKVAANRSPGYSHRIAESHYDWRTPIIRERRRFTDVMDEEIDDERKNRIDRYGSREGLDSMPDGLPADVVPHTNAVTPRRLRHELGTRLDAHAEAEAYMECKRDGHIPFFREKPQILPVKHDQPGELVCLPVGDPKPVVQWFKNDLVITENNRIKIIEDSDGRSILRLDPALDYDVGIYKVVARNKIGQTVTRTRIVSASVPAAPDSPEATDVSDTEILLKWKQPHEDGNSPILCYSLQYKEADKVDWIEVGTNIDHEFYLIGGLQPTTSYHFRLACCNRIGWSDKGIPTELVKTKEEGAPKVQISRAMRHLQQITESGAKVAIDDTKPHMDYSIEKNPPEWNDGCASDKFKFISEINRGRFSSVVKALEKSSDRVVAAKIFEWHQTPSTGSTDGAMTNGVLNGSGTRASESGEAAVQREFEALRSLRHERIAFLESAWHGGGIAAFIMEKLQGADVLTFLSSRHEYSEQMVATIITQVLDGLQYLHWRGYCHLDIQPDNIVMASVRSVQIKLVDFGSAQRVTRLGSPVFQVGHPEYAAPEMQSDDPVAYPQSDIWGVGVIAYVLLSGESPFKGATPEETHQNVAFVRFRFEYLYKELTQEATRFIMLIFKKAPSKRPLAEECHEHRWLLPTEFMIKKRERAVFLGNRLKEFSDKYHSERAAQASKSSESLSSALGGGGRGALLRSTSIQEELTAAT